METTTVLLTKDVVCEEAGDAMGYVDSRAAASTIMERMEEQVAALQLVDALRDERLTVGRVTESGRVTFVVGVVGDGDVASAAAVRGTDGWSVISEDDRERSDVFERGSATAATCFAACILLAASTVRAKDGDGDG